MPSAKRQMITLLKKVFTTYHRKWNMSNTERASTRNKNRQRYKQKSACKNK